MTGCRIVGRARSPVPAVTTGSRPIFSANSMPLSTVLIGPQGTPTAISWSNHSAADLAASFSASSGLSSARLAVRPGLVENLGSAESSGAPITSHSLRNWASLPAVTISSPSPVGSGS